MATIPIGGLFKYLLGMTAMIIGLYTIFKMLADKDFEGVDNDIKLIDKLTKTIVILGLTAVLCSKLGSQTNWKNILSFIANIIILIGATIGIIYLLNKYKESIPESISVAKDLAILIYL